MILKIDITGDTDTAVAKGQITGSEDDLIELIAQIASKEERIFKILKDGLDHARVRKADACTIETGPPEPYISIGRYDEHKSLAIILGETQELLSMIAGAFRDNITIHAIFESASRTVRAQMQK